MIRLFLGARPSIWFTLGGRDHVEEEPAGGLSLGYNDQLRFEWRLERRRRLSTGGGSTNNPGAGSTYADMSGVAKLIYDSIEADEDVSPAIEAVFEAFGVPILEVDDPDSAVARLDAGLPFVTTRVVTEMAAAYAGGRLVNVEGFVDGLVEQGVGLAYPYNLGGTPLDSTFLGGMMYGLTAGAEADPEMPLDEGTTLLALVRELGQERARRLDLDAAEPVWGDGRLDPLQFSLLSFSIFAKEAGTAKARILKPAPGLPKIQLHQSNPAADFLKDKVKDLLKDKVEDGLTNEAQSLLEVPLDKKDAAKVSVCGSLILYGHKVAMTNTPDLLWHAPKAPNFTTVEMTLTFEDDYYDNWARAVLGDAVKDLTGCAFPRKGPIEGKPIEWSVTDSLEDHGTFDIMSSMTDDLGKGVATWRTIKDDYPPACQVFDKQRDAVGATEAVVSGLLPGWSTVETIVTFLNPNTGSQGHDPLTVMYYEVTVDDTCHRE
jgi:hypothetical protein